MFEVDLRNFAFLPSDTYLRARFVLCLADSVAFPNCYMQREGLKLCRRRKKSFRAGSQVSEAPADTAFEDAATAKRGVGGSCLGKSWAS
jgi:hypothetical protein